MLHSVVEVQRLSVTSKDGQTLFDWQVANNTDGNPMSWVPCAIDTMYVRPGKDIPMPIEAGKAPDRTGLFICMPGWDIRSGDRLKTKPNAFGQQPIRGTFEIRTIPDQIVGYAGDVHHVEVQVVEVAQAVLPLLPTDAYPGTEE
jgi:hypothetical protein